MLTSNYYIYEHITPNGKHYMGQTCRRPEKRWVYKVVVMIKDKH